MKIECLVENIEKNIPLLGRIVPSHAQVPIFLNLLIEANKQGLFLSATDMEIGVKVKVPAKIEEEGAITVPARQFMEIISSLPKEKAAFVLEKDRFFVCSKENKMSLQTIPKEEFPGFFEKKEGENISLQREEFKNIFSKLVFAASRDETRPVLTGILISQKESVAHIVATDGYRLSFKKTGKTILEKKEELIVSARLIEEALLLKEDEKNLSLFVSRDSGQAAIEASGVTLVGRLVEGSFPNYEKVVPPSFKTKIVLDKDSFLRSLRLASVFARESANIVRLKAEDGILSIVSKASGVGEGEAKIDVEQEGQDNEISFNVRFVLDFLKNTQEKNLFFGMNSPVEPGLFKEVGKDDFLHVIMPVRVQE